MGVGPVSIDENVDQNPRVGTQGNAGERTQSADVGANVDVFAEGKGYLLAVLGSRVR